VRDPRAAAYSWGKRQLLPDPPRRHFQRFNPVRSSLYWLRWNLLIESVIRPVVSANYVLVRYEDFARFPDPSIRAICRLLGQDDHGISFSEGNTLWLEPNHMVDGNPLRFAAGEFAIAVDQAWTEEMVRRDRRLAAAVAAPLMWRYGYPLSTAQHRSLG
jgi:hypothetical protein